MLSGNVGESGPFGGNGSDAESTNVNNSMGCTITGTAGNDTLNGGSNDAANGDQHQRVCRQMFGFYRRETGRDLVLSVAQTASVGRDDAEVSRRVEATGNDPRTMRDDAFTGTPGQVVERLGRLAEAGATRFYFQVLDLHDLDHLELIASEVAPQL